MLLLPVSCNAAGATLPRTVSKVETRPKAD
jgi:hypothetical protein